MGLCMGYAVPPDVPSDDSPRAPSAVRPGQVSPTARGAALPDTSRRAGVPAVQDGESVLAYGAPVRTWPQAPGAQPPVPNARPDSPGRPASGNTPYGTASQVTSQGNPSSQGPYVAAPATPVRPASTATVFGLVSAPVSQSGIDPFAPARPAGMARSTNNFGGSEAGTAPSSASRSEDPFAPARGRTAAEPPSGSPYSASSGSYGSGSGPLGRSTAAYGAHPSPEPHRDGTSGGQAPMAHRNSPSAPYSVDAIAAEVARSRPASGVHGSQPGYDPASPRPAARPYVDPSRSAAPESLRAPLQSGYSPGSPLGTRAGSSPGYQPAAPAGPVVGRESASQPQGGQAFRPASSPGYQPGSPLTPRSSAQHDPYAPGRSASQAGQDPSALRRPISQPGMDPAGVHASASSPGLAPFAGQARPPGHPGRDPSGQQSAPAAPVAATPVQPTDADFLEALQPSTAAANLTTGDFYHLAQVCWREQLSSGAVLFADGSPATAAYLPCEGIFRQEFALPDGSVRPTSPLKTGEWCGEVALAGGTAHVGQVVAATDATVFVFTASSIAQLARVQPGLLVRLMGVAVHLQAKRARASQTRVDLFSQQVYPHPPEPATASEAAVGGLGKLFLKLTGGKEEP